MSEASRARLTIDGPVATVELGAPGETVALNPRMLHELVELLAAVEQDETVHVLVLRSAGAVFCAGAKLDDIVGSPGGGHSMMLGRAGGDANAVVRLLAESRLLTIAAVHGAAIGGGLALVLACDFAVAAEGSMLSVGYAAIGATPDMGMSFHLARAVGYHRALALYATSERVDAARARELGLVTMVVAPGTLHEETDAFARRLADGPSMALAQGKRLLQYAADATLTQQLDHELRSVADCAAGPEFQEGVRAFFEKRRPDFNVSSSPTAGGR